MTKFDITGMSCAACALKVEKAVRKVDGVTDCSVNLLTNSLTVEGDFDQSVIMGAVKNAGYGAIVSGEENTLDGKQNAHAREIKKLKVRLITSLGFLALLMYLSMFYQMWGAPIPEFLQKSSLFRGIICAVLALIVMCLNYKFFYNGVKGVIHLSPNMDTLVALGSFASYAYSLVVLILSETSAIAIVEQTHLYFDSAAMILVLVTIGKTLEAYSKGKTTNAINALISLTPKVATVINELGEQVTVGISRVKVGDVVIVKAGESIPIDGVIIEGAGSINQASLTGESIPVEKSVLDQVFTATIVVSGVIKVKVQKIGEDTSLSKIIKMVSQASGGKAPVAKIADKVSGVFVPVVLSIAIIATVVWLIMDVSLGQALSYGISVLVVSCPCALGLATPVAIMVSSGVGAKHGILFKSATDIETLGKCKVIAFDKTGTITEGNPTVTDVWATTGVSEDRLLRTAYALEVNSIHPLAKSICEYCKQKGVLFDQVAEYQDKLGKGVCGFVYGAKYFAGSFEFISKIISLTRDEERLVKGFSESGKTPILVCSESEFLGILALKDVIKKDVALVIKALKKLKIKTYMITGDNLETANAIANEVGIDNVIAGVLPEKKGEIIENLKSNGKVAMVGDGINDALALTVADCGIAVGCGTDVAIDAGSVVLLNSKFIDVLGAINLSRSTLKVIYQNLFWAFIYNLIGIPLAFGAFSVLGLTLSPMFCAGAMSVSSVLVVSNALRINLFNVYKGVIDKKDKEGDSVPDLIEKTLIVEGLMCNHCEKTVKQALESIDRLKVAIPDYKSGMVEIKVESSVSDKEIERAIEDCGFKLKQIIKK